MLTSKSVFFFHHYNIIYPFISNISHGNTKRIVCVSVESNELKWVDSLYVLLKSSKQSILQQYFLGCDPNKFSPGCNHSCPTKCKSQHCDAFNGSCIHGLSDPNALTIDCIGYFLLLLNV